MSVWPVLNNGEPQQTCPSGTSISMPFSSRMLNTLAKPPGWSGTANAVTSLTLAAWPASFKISIGATEYADTLGASGIHYFNFKLNSSSYTKKTNEHLITIPAASNCTTSWTTNDKLYYLAVDKASNISEGYMLLSVKNANSGSCTVSLDVTP